MKVKVETCATWSYVDLSKAYGHVLHKYGLTAAYDGSAYIIIDRIEDLFELDNDIRAFCDECEDWCVYFGILIRNSCGSPELVIRDNYD